MCSATFYIIWYTLNKIAHFKSVPLLLTVSSIFWEKIVHMIFSKLFRYFLHYLVYFETKSCTMVFKFTPFYILILLIISKWNYTDNVIQIFYSPIVYFYMFSRIKFKIISQSKQPLCCQNNQSHTIYCSKLKRNNPKL